MNFLPETDPRWQVWKQCESPIEQYLACGLFCVLGCQAVEGPYNPKRRKELAAAAGPLPTAFVFSQHRVEPYRLDFLVVLIDPIKRISQHFAIECDGQEFHSSDEQMMRDRDRDEYITSIGYRFVARYTGSHIFQDMPSALREIGAFLLAFGVRTGVPVDCHDYAEMLKIAMRSRSGDRAEREERRALAAQMWEEELREIQLVEHGPEFV